VKNSTYQRHGASHHDASATAPTQRHNAAHGVRHSTPTCTTHNDSFQIQSISAAEEEVFGLENPTALRRSVWGESSNSLQTRAMSQRERGREVAHWGEERRALLGTPSIHLCQTLL
jgi:hypothetical protein